MRERRQIVVQGIVQGVGFRSFAYRLARRFDLGGFVLNSTEGLSIEIEGEAAGVEAFLSSLRESCPPLASVDRVECERILSKDETSFRIAVSAVRHDRRVLVSSDTATCDDCLAELFDPNNRRFGYPFINCTNCGPRFTIIQDMPYDRERSTMADFAVCSECRREFEDPDDRRFHAQAIACWECGPRLGLADASSRELPSEDPIQRATELLGEGAIVAVKGLGGYHLACDAFHNEAVGRIRRRKHREEKPFALMASDLESTSKICFVDPEEERLLCSPSRPIVLLKKREPNLIAEEIAPRQNFLGVMLPYTPLHHLLLKRAPHMLVMTSGNPSQEPICRTNEEAFSRLRGIADYFLVHNRTIQVRCDDSVMRSVGGRQLIIRRSRGFVPRSISLSKPFAKPVLACGAQLKNTFCLGKDHYAFLSHHIGDLQNYETFTSFIEDVEHFKRLFGVVPLIVAHDLHPGYLSTRYALDLNGVSRVAVQHHHAHVASCMAEHGLEGPVIGVAFDGLGYGADGAIWGGEFLISSLIGYERRAHFRYIPLAGGDTAVRQPWRSAVAYILDALGSDPVSLRLPGWDTVSPRNLDLVQSMIRQGTNTVPTSSCGRLFDAVAAIVGFRHQVNYEGQAAVELEMAAQPGIDSAYEFDINQGRCWEIDFRPTIKSIAHEVEKKWPVPLIAAKFQNTVVMVIVEVCRRLREMEDVNRVCLSGGTFQNLYILERVIPRLQEFGFEVFRNVEVPPNDGGISLGQAVIADAMLRKGE